jgi:predicted DCC family thiol-disulfide oxidoreductase YuxK
MGADAEALSSCYMTAPTPYPTRVTVWYDGACPLCLAEIGLVRRLDRAGAIAFVDARAISDHVDTGWSEEIATKQDARAPIRVHRSGLGSSAADAAPNCPLSREALLARFHAQERDGPLVSGAAAFAAMWRAIPILAPFGHAARFGPIGWVFERLYRVFLRFRPRLQALARRA